MPSPVSMEHSSRHAAVMLWLGIYLAATPGLRLLDNATVILDAENEVQPDAALCLAKGGQTEVVDPFLHGAPELVVEVVTSSAAYDLHDKLRVYRRTGVREYVIFLTLEQATIWYRLNKGRYDEVTSDETGVIHSREFPGLTLNVEKFWADDLPGLLGELQRGLSNEEHAAFEARLV